MGGFTDEERQKSLLRRRTLQRLWRKIYVRTALWPVALAAIGLLGMQIIAWPVQSPVGRANVSVDSATWGLLGQDVMRNAFVEKGFSLEGQLNWKFETSKPIHGSPAVSGGVVFLATGDARVLAIDEETGELLWERKTNGPVDRSPVATQSTVYVALRDGRLLALDSLTGDIRWAFLSRSNSSATPTISDGVVYFGTGSGNLHAIDAETGKELWSYSTGNWIVGSPVIYRNVIAYTDISGDVWFIDIHTGRKRMEFNTLQAVKGSPAFLGSTLYMGTQKGTILAIDSNALEYPLERAMRRVRTVIFRYGYGTPPIPKGFVWAERMRDTPRIPDNIDPSAIAQLSPRAQLALMRQARGGLANFSDPAVTEEAIYFMSANGELFGLNPETGEVLWSYDSKATADTSPAVAGDLVYVGTDLGHIHVVNRFDGELVKSVHIGGPLRGQVVVSNNRLLISSKDGNLYSIR